MSDPPLSEVDLKMACVCTTLNFFLKFLRKKSIIVCVLLGATAVTGQDRRIRSRSRQRRLQEDGPVRGRRLQSRRNDGRSRRMGGRRQ